MKMKMKKKIYYFLMKIKKWVNFYKKKKPIFSFQKK